MEIPVEILMMNERMFEGFITFKYLLSSSGKIENGFYKTTKGVHIYTIFISSLSRLKKSVFSCSCYNVHVTEEECIFMFTGSPNAKIVT